MKFRKMKEKMTPAEQSLLKWTTDNEFGGNEVAAAAYYLGEGLQKAYEESLKKREDCDPDCDCREPIKKYSYFVNGEKFQSSEMQISGIEIRRAAGIVDSSFNLYLECARSDDSLIFNSTQLFLDGYGEVRLYTIPSNINGG